MVNDAVTTAAGRYALHVHFILLSDDKDFLGVIEWNHQRNDCFIFSLSLSLSGHGSIEL